MMARVSTYIQKDYGTTVVQVDGLTVAGITDLTPKKALVRFIRMVGQNAGKLSRLLRAAEARTKWNINHPGEGREWPEHKELEKFRDQLLREAGVVDS